MGFEQAELVFGQFAAWFGLEFSVLKGMVSEVEEGTREALATNWIFVSVDMLEHVSRRNSTCVMR